jgi:hypothetical protein
MPYSSHALCSPHSTPVLSDLYTAPVTTKRVTPSTFEQTQLEYDKFGFCLASEDRSRYCVFCSASLLERFK